MYVPSQPQCVKELPLLQAIFFGEKWRAPEMAWGPWKDEHIKGSGKKGGPTRGTTISRPPAQPPPRAPEKEQGLELSEGPPSSAAPTMT